MQPKLRSDVIVSPQGDSFVVKDSATGRFFRFGEVEHFIARQADGSTPAEVIRQRTEERFQAPLAPASVKTFIEKLQRLGLLEREEKRSKLKMLEAGPRPEEIELARRALETAKTRREHARRRYEEAERMHASRLAKARADLSKAEERLKYARNDLERFSMLFEKELIARRQLEEAEERVEVREKEAEAVRAELRLVLADDLAEVRKELAVASREVEESSGKLALLLAGSRPEEIEAARAEVARLEAQRGYLRTQLELVRVVSPIAGVITTPKLKEKVGQYVKKGDLIAEVHQLDTVRVEIAVSEKDIGDVRARQPVVLKARAFPEVTFSGIVTEMAPAAVKEQQEAWRGKVFRVTTEIDNPAGLLKPEMTGNAKIFCGKRRVLDLLTRRLARYIRVEFWSWW